MRFDDLVGQLSDLKQQGAASALADLEKALATSAEVGQKHLIIAAYIAGVEDALTGTAGRPEYDLRRLDFVAQAQNSLSDTGRALGDRAMDDFISQANQDR